MSEVRERFEFGAGRPMSEAPRDGTPILIIYRSGHAHICAFGENGKWWEFSGGFDRYSSLWDDPNNEESDCCGWHPLPEEFALVLGCRDIITTEEP